MVFLVGSPGHGGKPSGNRLQGEGSRVELGGVGLAGCRGGVLVGPPSLESGNSSWIIWERWGIQSWVGERVGGTLVQILAVFLTEAEM